MADQKNLELAKATFATLCQTLEENQWKYKKNEEKFSIECGARGDDLAIDIAIKVDVERQLVLLLSHLPFVVAEDKRLDMAIAVSVINNALVDGCFDYDVKSGHMFFRMTNSYMESKIGTDVFAYMLYGACTIVDEYNDKLLMLCKGMLSMEQFLKAMKQ